MATLIFRHTPALVACLALLGPAEGCVSPDQNVGATGAALDSDAGVPSSATPDGGSASTTLQAVDSDFLARLEAQASAPNRLEGAAQDSFAGPRALGAGPMPRQPHTKPPHPYDCGDVEGPNIVRFKFHEGTAVRLNTETGKLWSQAVRSDRQLARDLAAIANRRNIAIVPAIEGTESELGQLKAVAEANTNRQMPDLRLWFDAVVGREFVEDAGSRPQVCNRVAQVANFLNRRRSVEVAFPSPGDTPPPDLIQFPLQEDIPPRTPFVLEPAHMAPFPGLNSPRFLAGLPQFSLGESYQGLNVGVVDIEYNFSRHEKFNVNVIGGHLDTGFRDHGVNVMGTVFGTWTDGTRRYGTRGFVPKVERGFSAQKRRRIICVLFVCFPIVRNDIASAIHRAGRATEPGDVILIEAQDDNKGPVESKGDLYDTIVTWSAAGRIIVEPAGNGNQNLNTYLPTRARSGALIVSANNADGTTRTGRSSFGNRVDLNAWGRSVATSSDGTGRGIIFQGTDNYEAYRGAFAGTSSASALVAGATAQFMSTFQGAYEQPIAAPSRIASALRRTFVTSGTPSTGQIGSQPNVGTSILHFGMATRMNDCALGVAMRPPHDEYMTGLAFSMTPIFASYSPTGCAKRATGSDGDSAIWLFEGLENSPSGSLDMPRTGPLDLGRNSPEGLQLGDGLTIESWVRIPRATNNWQAIVEKEVPRNYVLAVGPIGHPAEGGLHFSYDPSGTPGWCFYNSEARIDDGQPHHVAVTWTVSLFGPIITLWIDGERDSTGFACGAGAPRTNGAQGYIARVAARMASGAEVADVRLYHRPLSSTEIEDHANGIGP